MNLHALSTRLDWVTTVIGWVTAWCVSFMVILQVALVLLRYVFGYSVIFAQDSVVYLNAAIFLMGIGYTMMRDRHVRVDFLYRNVSDRHRAMIDAGGIVFFVMPFCVTVLYFALPYAARSWAIWEGAREATGLHLTFLLKSGISVFASLLLLQAIASLLRILGGLYRDKADGR